MGFWGNTSNQQKQPKKFANISNDQINSNQQAVPVKYLAGRAYVAGDYISPAYNPKAVPIKTQTGKGETSTTGYKYFCDFALMFCTGGRRPVDAIYKVIVDSDIRWTGNVVRGVADYETIAVQDLGTLNIYWGTETQPIDATLLTPRAVSIGTGDPQDATTFPPNPATGGAPTSGGLAAGDRVLQQMRDRLERVFRASDYVLRWGGEEFLAVARTGDRGRRNKTVRRRKRCGERAG